MLEIYTLGGYDEVGKNMTVVKADDEAVILDMGLHMDRYIRLTEDRETVDVSTTQLQEAKAIPNDYPIRNIAKYVKAIIPSHAHLDHIGAMPFLAKKYKAPIMAAPFTMEVIKSISEDRNRKISNQLKVLELNKIHKISKTLQVELINVTHSTPQTAIVAVHTKYGTVLYCNDFKLDNTPTLGDKPNYARLKELSKKGIKAMVLNGLKSQYNTKTTSESIAREMLKDTFSTLKNKRNAIFVTTFSSQIARLKSIVELGKSLNRKIVFLGRSLHKYVTAAENVGIYNFSDKVDLTKYSNQIKRKLKDIQKKRDKYLVVLTGHQGEPKAVLPRIVDGHLPFHFKGGDYVIFSCGVIPVEENILHRQKLENDLKKQGVRIYKDLHSSGHASREDMREMIELTKPKHLIPVHADTEMLKPLANLAVSMGYKLGKTVHLAKDGQKLDVS